jgi:glycosyltransferase involved in cell wall biosynthesis
LSRPHIAPHYIDEIRRLTNARIVYYGHDLHFRRLMAANELQPGSVSMAEINTMKAAEIALCTKADLAFFPSAEEAAIAGELVGRTSAVRSISAYCFDEAELSATRSALAKGKARSEVMQLLFVGGFNHAPNRDGLLWFCGEIWPRLTKVLNATLSVAGSNPDVEILALAGQDINVLGYVSDAELLALYQSADVVIAPLRYGAGVKGKVIEAMARGLPVVTTSVGAQGIENAAEMLFIADDADAFVDAIMKAADPDVVGQRTVLAVEYVARCYSSATMTNSLTDALFCSATATGALRSQVH